VERLLCKIRRLNLSFGVVDTNHLEVEIDIAKEYKNIAEFPQVPQFLRWQFSVY